MYKIYRAKKINGKVLHKVYIGKAATPGKCVKIINDVIRMHNDGVVMHDPERRYVHVRGDITEQIAQGLVHTYMHDFDYPAWINKHHEENTVVCDVCVEYAYHRRGITKDIHFENNLDVVSVWNHGQIIFYWEEV